MMHLMIGSLLVVVWPSWQSLVGILQHLLLRSPQEFTLWKNVHLTMNISCILSMMECTVLSIAFFMIIQLLFLSHWMWVNNLFVFSLFLNNMLIFSMYIITGLSNGLGISMFHLGAYLRWLRSSDWFGEFAENENGRLDHFWRHGCLHNTRG